MDYYKILNVNEDATLKEIEQAYKDLSSFYNPENNVSKNAYKRYREVMLAYKVLSEIKQREMYDRLHVKENELHEEIKGEVIGIDSYISNSQISNYAYETVYEDVRVIEISMAIPYLYYLANSDYIVEFDKEIVIKQEGICNTCIGQGKVRKENKMCVCPDCFGSGINSLKKKVKEEIRVRVNDEHIILDKEEYKLKINFDFYDREFYRIENNEIFMDLEVSETEYDRGIKYTLLSDDMTLHIESLGFNDSTYTFLDKIIHIRYKLSKYRGKDIEAYIVDDRKILYLNLNDFTYKDVVDETHTYKLVLDDEILTLEGLGKKGYNDKNGNLILRVIKIKNDNDHKLFFNKTIKKVSANLFKFKGIYNNHNFTKNKRFDYDDNYIYLPSRAYKLKSKNYLAFKFIYALLYLLIPFVLYFIMGFSLTYVITICIYSVIYLLAINLLMEVKI